MAETPEKNKPISIDSIRTDGGTQMRAELDKDVYFDYRDKWLSGVEFDPVELFHDGSTYWLADGFHRYYGAREAKRASIPAHNRQGTQRDAVLFAAGANAAHGLRRSNADKRMAVLTLLNDEEWVNWSDGKIADQVAVSQNFVSDIRRQLKSDLSSPAAIASDQPRIGRDGKNRKPRPKPMAPQADDSVPFDEVEFTDREPTDYRVEPEHDESIVDGLKCQVPANLQSVFAEVKEFNKLRRLCADIKAGVKNLCESPAGRWLSYQAIEGHTNEIKRILRFSAPHTECAKCRRKPAMDCKSCRGTGWVNEAMASSSFTEFDTKWLEDRL